MRNDCVFCAIVDGEIPSFKIYEDDVILAYLDINPVTKGHTLVIPKEHTKGLLDTDEKVLGEIVARLKKVASHVAFKLGCDGFNIMQNNGEAAGQTVHHLHFHIIPRWNGTPLTFEHHEGDMAALGVLADELRM